MFRNGTDASGQPVLRRPASSAGVTAQIIPVIASATKMAPETAVNVARLTICTAAFVFLDMSHPSQGRVSVIVARSAGKA